jgi:methylated-DNA-[protein]-cysteine S-methyltransferase
MLNWQRRQSEEQMMMAYTRIDSPLGDLLLVGERHADGVVLASVSFSGQRNPPRPQPGWTPDATAFTEVARQLSAYFDGRLSQFDLAFADSGTPFQQRVWAALETIPYGVTTTYGQLAEMVGAPRDRIRAVGAAIGANPLLIVRPCHRVVGANGSLTGYAGSVSRKERLLTLEGALQPLFA